MIFKDSLGVDIRDDDVVIAYLKKTLSGIKTVAHAVYSLEKNLPLTEKLIALNALLTDFIQENGIGNIEIFLGISDNLVLFRNIELPMAVKENFRGTIRYEMEKYIPISAEDVYFDCQIFDEDKKNKQIKLLLVIAKKTAIEPYLDFCKNMPYAISGIEVSSTSVSNFLAYASNNKDPEGFIQKSLKGYSAPESLLAEASRAKNKSLPQEVISAFGLALKGLLTIPVQINLLPQEYRRRAGKMGYYIMIGLVCLTVLSGAALGGSYLFRKYMAIKELDGELNRLTSEVKEIEQIQEQIAIMEAKADNYNSLLKGHVAVSDIIGELSRIIPETAWIRDLSISNKNIQLQGYADSASEIIGILEASPFFQDVLMLSAIVKERDGKERFSISLKLQYDTDK